jgi:hypothetical protein
MDAELTVRPTGSSFNYNHVFTSNNIVTTEVT